MKTLRSLALITLCLTAGAMYCGHAMAQAAPYTTYYRYDAAGHVVGVITADPDGSGLYAAVRSTYNAQGLLATVENGQLATWQAGAPSAWTGFTVFQTRSMSYDADGRQIQASVASGSTTYSLSQTSYDNQGRVDCSVTRMNPATFGSTQPTACNLGAEGTYGPDRITKTTYDAVSHVLKVQLAYGTSEQQDVATYTYTDNLQTSARDANGNLTSYSYDGFGRLTDQYFPSPTTTGQSNTSDFEHYDYDNNGNRTSLRRRDTSIIGYSYDALNRLSSKDIPGGTTGDVFYDYDLRGLRRNARFGSPTGLGISTQYDGFARVTSRTNNSDGTARTLTYQYDADGNRLRTTYPDTLAFSYGYDGLNRPTFICEGAVTCNATASPVISIAYDNQGRRASLKRGANVASTGYLYDPISRLQTLNINLDGTGTTNDVSIGFTYNPADQMVSRNISNGAYAYTNGPAASKTYTPNGLNQYTSIVGPTTVSPTWDANGNFRFGGVITYTYDVENRLTNTSGGAAPANLSYDPDGMLYDTNDGTTAGDSHFLYDGNELVAEYNSTGAMVRRYVHGPGADEPLVSYDNAAVGAANRSYLIANHQGSVSAITNSSGSTTQINTYDAYGNPGSGNAGRFQFTGQVWLSTIGLYYYKARVYSPLLGRFMQTDPVGYADDFNLYAYTRNDPLNRFDPNGEDSFTVARRLDSVVGKLGVGHAYNVSHARYVGDPNARIYSYGKLDNGRMGSVVDSKRAADVSKTTAASDAAHWKSLARNTVTNVSKIDAPDDVVAAVAGSVSENRKYALTPSNGGLGADSGRVTDANSNSAAFAVGDKSEQVATDDPKATMDRKPFTLTLPGADVSKRVEFKCTEALKGAGAC